MRLANGSTEGHGSLPMTRHSTNPPPLFMDRLMARVDPHQPARPDDSLVEAQSACGRWFALRRLHIGLSSKQVANLADVPVENILLLESGLGDSSSLGESARHNLSRHLSMQKSEHDWIKRVIAAAQGYPDALDDSVLAPVLAYLDAVDTGALDRVAAEEPAPVETTATAPSQGISLEGDRDRFEVLLALGEQENYVYAVWERIHENHAGLGLGEVGLLIDSLIDSGLIEEKEDPLIDPSLDSEPLQIYRITGAGWRALEAEQRRRQAEQRRRQAEGGETGPGRPPSDNPIPQNRKLKPS